MKVFVTMARLLDQAVDVRSLLPLPTEVCRAVDDPLRATLLDLLAEEAMNVEELTAALKDRGFDRAPTTVRHHLDLLKEAGLVELGALEEAGGAVVKYYRANTRLLGYELDEARWAALEPVLDDVTARLGDLLAGVLRDHGETVTDVAESLKDCPYCATPHFTEFVLLKLLERAAAEAVPDAVPDAVATPKET